MGQKPKGLADYPRAALCGPDAENADRCADARVKPTPSWRTTEFPCDGARTIDGEVTVCTHGCHELPTFPTGRSRDRGLD